MMATPSQTTVTEYQTSGPDVVISSTTIVEINSAQDVPEQTSLDAKTQASVFSVETITSQSGPGPETSEPLTFSSFGPLNDAQPAFMFEPMMGGDVMVEPLVGRESGTTPTIV